MSSSITNSEAAGRPKPDRRRVRGYVAAAISLAVAWLVATMWANILVDPQAMFGLDHRAGHLASMAVPENECLDTVKG